MQVEETSRDVRALGCKDRFGAIFLFLIFLNYYCFLWHHITTIVVIFRQLLVF